MNLNDYFDHISVNNTKRYYLNPDNQLIEDISQHTKENPIKSIDDFDVAIIGVTREKDHIYDQKGLEEIRSYLYSLSSLETPQKIIDLGNLKIGNSQRDAVIGLRDVIVELITSRVLPIIIGPSEIILYANYLAYAAVGEKINLISIDSKIDITQQSKEDYKSPLWRILVEEKDSLFTFTNIGYQSHFVSTNITKFLSDQFHFAYRLGYIKTNIIEAENILRDADMLGLNISSVRQSDAFGQNNASPNGFFGDEICQLARYAGMSTKLSAFGIYDYIPENDINNQTTHLIAQIIWYFLSGINSRIIENPVEDSDEYKKFIVNLDTFEYEIIFYKSEKTERWWMEVPSFKSKNHKNLLISCSYKDYQNASNGDVPDRWLKAFQKINN